MRILPFLLPAALGLDTQQPPYTDGWTKGAREVHSETPYTFTIVVREQGVEEIKRIASAVSDPESSTYGQFISQAKLDEITAPLPHDMSAVTGWLETNGLSYHQYGVSNLIVTTTTGKAGKALSTTFHAVSNKNTQQLLVRAESYELPTEVHASVDAIFGLHGLPLPPRVATTLDSSHRRLQIRHMPANVTPAVLWTTYEVPKTTKTSKAVKIRQAVAEFQGQFMNGTDLKTLFRKYVGKIDPDYVKGTDDTVYKTTGENTGAHPGVEAELDIQYMMGISPGVKAEFWSFPGMDFGGDLNQWTSNLTAKEDIPLVHSVSYGWQGNLSQIHVKDSDVQAIDRNFAKLAAKGISIMISSGDSGSGYTEPRACDATQPGQHLGAKGVGIKGTVERTIGVQEEGMCCQEAAQGIRPTPKPCPKPPCPMPEKPKPAPGWTFVPHEKKKPPPPPEVTMNRRQLQKPKPKKGGSYTFTKAVFHVQEDMCRDPAREGCKFKARDTFELSGKLTAEGGDVTATLMNGTAGTEVTLKFGKFKAMNPQQGQREVNTTVGGTKYHGNSDFLDENGKELCFVIELMAEGKNGAPGEQVIMEHGPNPPPPPPPGICTIYKTVEQKTQANETTFSGFKKKAPLPVLWPSWPASSPWVTSVGATRFVGQKVGNDEMASDQFGSGGGFSKQFDQTDAAWQVEATAN